jgi:hypothetical protein
MEKQKKIRNKFFNMEFPEQTLINLIQHITQYTECLNLRQSNKKSNNMI